MNDDLTDFFRAASMDFSDHSNLMSDLHYSCDDVKLERCLVVIRDFFATDLMAWDFCCCSHRWSYLDFADQSSSFLSISDCPSQDSIVANRMDCVFPMASVLFERSVILPF